ncbi:MAG TPA: SRPBCC family protein [Bacteroidia bacterium]|nr:SRPBCC family protein [Bacteroidia bacterium]
METQTKTAITVATTINAPVEKVWRYWTELSHITQWYNASDYWHAPHAENDLRVNGKFKTTMAAKDGSASFDFEGVYTKVEMHKQIDYVIEGGRKVSIYFMSDGDTTKVTETFEPENENPLELQRVGWQAILDSFKKYAESH